MLYSRKGTLMSYVTLHAEGISQPLCIRENTLDRYVFDEIFLRGQYAVDPSALRKYAALKEVTLKEPEIIFDLGANIGLSAVYFAEHYPMIHRDLLITAALFHDIEKIQEIADFPLNDYTDDGQMLGHIYIGARAMEDAAAKIPGFPPKLKNELVHCILSHHGKLEFGSPKVPAIMEAMALHMADNADAKLQTLTEVFKQAGDDMGWLGYNRMFESNLRRTSND